VANVLDIMDLVVQVVRSALFWGAAVLALVAAVDWMVRTRRVNPFGPVARFFRASVDPLLAPIERRVVRAGGMPASAPWWALIAVIVGGIALLSVLAYVRDLFRDLFVATGAGPSQVARVLVAWVYFGVCMPQGITSLPGKPEWCTNHSDTVLFVTAAMILLAHALEQRKKSVTYRALGLGAIILAGIVLNNRRLAFVSLFVAALVMYLALKPSKRKRRVTALLAVAPLVLPVFWRRLLTEILIWCANNHLSYMLILRGSYGGGSEGIVSLEFDHGPCDHSHRFHRLLENRELREQFRRHSLGGLVSGI